MKSTGIVRNIDALGRFVIPSELRANLDIKSDDPLEIYVEEDRIILRKHTPSCIFCGGRDGIVEYENKLVCKSCIDKLNDIKK